MTKFFTGLFLVIFVALSPFSTKAETIIEHEFDFVIAHKPDNQQNVSLITEFARNVSERTNGKIVIHPVILGGDHDETLDTIRSKLYTGEIGMSQTSVKKFVNYSPTIDALDMPLVFRNHAHVKKVLDGEIGQKLISDLYKGSNNQILGLDFTYSGGFRNIYTVGKPVHSVAELKGMKIRARSNRSGRDVVHYLGMVQSQNLVHDFRPASIRGDVFAEEAETLRLLTYRNINPDLVKHIKTVLVTNHSVFLTLITIYAPLFEKMTPEQQAIIKEEARALSLKERKLSIQQAIDGRKMFEKQGIQFIEASDEDKKILQDMANKVYAKYEGQPVSDMMKAIINTQ